MTFLRRLEPHLRASPASPTQILSLRDISTTMTEKPSSLLNAEKDKAVLLLERLAW